MFLFLSFKPQKPLIPFHLSLNIKGIFLYGIFRVVKPDAKPIIV